MNDRRKHRDASRAIDVGRAWIALGPIFRVLIAVAIIFVVGWLALQAMQLVTMLAFVLA